MLVYEIKGNVLQKRESPPTIVYTEHGTLNRLDNHTLVDSNGKLMVNARPKSAFNTQLEYVYPGEYRFVVPQGITRIKVLVIGGGRNAYMYHVGRSNIGYQMGSGAISALLQVTPGETIPLQVGTNGDGVWSYDGRIGTLGGVEHKYTNNQAGGTAYFGSWIEAPTGSGLTDKYNVRPECVFKPRKDGDMIIHGFKWDMTTVNGKLKRYRIPTSINTETVWAGDNGVGGSRDEINKYVWPTLKAVCDNIMFRYDNLPRKYDNLAWYPTTTTSTQTHGYMMGGTRTRGSVSYFGGNAYGLFGIGGTGQAGTSTVQSASGGDAINFGGMGGYPGKAYQTNTWSGSTGHCGPGGIFIWY